jgi:hypothetical protein
MTELLVPLVGLAVLIILLIFDLICFYIIFLGLAWVFSGIYGLFKPILSPIVNLISTHVSPFSVYIKTRWPGQKPEEEDIFEGSVPYYSPIKEKARGRSYD